ncbi:MAG: hypothetical protein JNK78_14810 [Planctomycetes bacterium]|nr:hypothetical protein [Planctomycetota bacterium]
MATVWAGPLSRFYARRGGELDRLRAGVEAWRADLRASVAEKVAEQLRWDEGSAVAATFDAGDAGWMALRLFAFYAEKPEFELPDAVPPLLEFDPEWRAAADAKFATSKFGQLLACSMWLPGDFPVTFRAPLPDGDSAEIGSVGVLADQVKWLNQRTFAADVEEVASWSGLAAPAGGDLLTAARRGLWALSAGVAVAVRERMPVLVVP